MSAPRSLNTCSMPLCARCRRLGSEALEHRPRSRALVQQLHLEAGPVNGSSTISATLPVTGCFAAAVEELEAQCDVLVVHVLGVRQQLTCGTPSADTLQIDGGMTPSRMRRTFRSWRSAAPRPAATLTAATRSPHPAGAGSLFQHLGVKMTDIRSASRTLYQLAITGDSGTKPSARSERVSAARRSASSASCRARPRAPARRALQVQRAVALRTHHQRGHLAGVADGVDHAGSRIRGHQHEHLPSGSRLAASARTRWAGPTVTAARR